MSREVDAARELIDEITKAVCRATGAAPEYVVRFVRPAVDYLQTEYGGGRLYVPAFGRTYPVDEIRRDFNAGKTVRWICDHYSISRRTLFRLLG